MDKIENMEEFVKAALSHDTYFQMSDDHRAYSAGRRSLERIEAFAQDNEMAGKLWKVICKGQSESFFAHQLIKHVEAVIFADDRDEMTKEVNALEDFCVWYLASTGRDSLVGKSIRDRIAKAINAPPGWAWEQRDEREAQIDAYVEKYERKAR